MQKRNWLHFILFVQVLVTDSKYCSLWNLSKLPISCSSSRLGRRMATIKRQTMTNCSWWVIHNYTKKKITITNKCQWQRIGQFFLARQLWIFASIFICLLSFSKQIRPAFENFVQTIDSKDKVSTPLIIIMLASANITIFDPKLIHRWLILRPTCL